MNGLSYSEFLKSKLLKVEPSGFAVDDSDISPVLFQFQHDIVRWACKRGKAAIFADCGLGKTFMQIEWARLVHKHTGGKILILAPLAVSSQTVREGQKLGIRVTHCRESSDVWSGINITNYERIEKFNPTDFAGVVLDESSILKDFAGKLRNTIIERFLETPYKLACTATPAPNDYMELGNHAEFLNVMSRSEMLAMFFIHDGADTAKWRLKGHVEDNVFWQWLCEWAVMMSKPSDLGYEDEGFNLPPLNFVEHITKSENTGDTLFVREASGLMERRRARKESLDERVKIACNIVGTSARWLVWCDLNEESQKLTEGIQDVVEVKGSDPVEHKEQSLLGFADGNIRVLVSKPSIAGHGMNFQGCNGMVFVGLSDSYEAMYQAIRRCWRFGQKHPVHVHIVLSEREGSILKNIKRKEEDFQKMIANMIKHTASISSGEIRKAEKQRSDYRETESKGKNWTLVNGDSVEVSKRTPADSIDYTIFSPPFASLYTYSDSERDMGNSRGDEFMIHFRYLVAEMFRVTKPGRLVSIHCMDIPAMKERDGYIGLKDFPGELIRMMQEEGFVYHSRCTIWKDPLIEATRTKALGLMHKQIQKDSARCRQGLPDYILTFVKPGENVELISHPDGFTRFIGMASEEPNCRKGERINKDSLATRHQGNVSDLDPVYSHHVWRKYASPVWMDINQTNTLNKELAREDKDERHIAPLQLDVIARCLEMWTNPGDLVCSWFAGIGSEGYVALQMGRRFFGVELKKSYAAVACHNLDWMEKEADRQMGLFA